MFRKAISRRRGEAESLTPNDFHYDGETGPTLDLVGPGEAYDEWLQTPVYKAWSSVAREVCEAFGS